MDVAIAYPGPDMAVVTVHGQLDTDAAPALHDAFEELGTRAVPRIVVDLTALTFCDSMGLSTVVLAHHRCVDAGGWVRLAGPTPFMVRLLSVVGVADIVPMYRTVEAARYDDRAELIARSRSGIAA